MKQFYVKKPLHKFSYNIKEKSECKTVKVYKQKNVQHFTLLNYC